MPNSIPVDKLARLIGTPGCPALLDIRTDEDVAADPHLIPGAARRPWADVAAWGGALAGLPRGCHVRTQPLAERLISTPARVVTWNTQNHELSRFLAPFFTRNHSHAHTNYRTRSTDSSRPLETRHVGEFRHGRAARIQRAIKISGHNANLKQDEGNAAT